MNRIALLLGLGAAGLAAVLLVPGPEIEPYHAPPDTTPRFTLAAADSVRAGLGASEAFTRPRLVNLDETLAYLGNVRAVYGQQPGFGDTIVLSLRIDEQGRVGPTQRLYGNGPSVGAAEMVARHQRFSPALDASGAPTAVWWPVRIATRVPMTLELEGMARGRLPGRPTPPGGFSVTDLEEGKPTFTPLDELPKLLNPAEVARVTAETLRSRPGSDRFSLSELPVFFLIDRDGTVRRAVVDGYGGNDPVFETMLQVAQAYRFSPARKDGEPVVSWVRLWIPIRPDSAVSSRSGPERSGG